MELDIAMIIVMRKKKQKRVFHFFSFQVKQRK